MNVHTHMYKLGLDDIGIYCDNTYFIAKSITVLLYTYHDIFLISFSAECQLYNRVYYSSDTFIATCTYCMKNTLRLFMTAAVIVILNTVFDKHSLQTGLSVSISFMP